MKLPECGKLVWGRVSDPSKPGKARQALIHWLKFNVVGGIGIGVQLAALSGFRSFLHLDYLLATVLAVETAVLHNFLWHERFTWTDRPARHFRHSLVSILGNLLLMRLLVGALQMNYFAANVIAIAACSLVNFLLSDCFVFQAEPRT
jgi:putative flippase GtrA